MAINCGIAGLPNVDKSTIFSALSNVPAKAASCSFCTINPNVGIGSVPGVRLVKLAEIFKPQRLVPAIVEFVDIAGLVKRASKGEGLGNQFLSYIREVEVIAYVVRCFDDPDLVHVNNKVDPDSDMETIAIELALADLDTLAKWRERATRALKGQAKTEQKNTGLALTALDNGLPARSVTLSDDEKAAVYDCHFSTMKLQCNVDEAGMRSYLKGALGGDLRQI